MFHRIINLIAIGWFFSYVLHQVDEYLHIFWFYYRCTLCCHSQLSTFISILIWRTHCCFIIFFMMNINRIETRWENTCFKVWNYFLSHIITYHQICRMKYSILLTRALNIKQLYTYTQQRHYFEFIAQTWIVVYAIKFFCELVFRYEM